GFGGADHLLPDDPRGDVAADVPPEGGQALSTAQTASAAPAGTGVRPARRRRSPRAKAYSAFRATMIAVVVLVFVVPLLWMVMASFKTNVDIQNTAKTFSFTPILDNYRHVLANDDYLGFVRNSFVVAFLATGISLLLGVPAAYSMSRFNMHKSALVVLLARIIP